MLYIVVIKKESQLNTGSRSRTLSTIDILILVFDDIILSAIVRHSNKYGSIRQALRIKSLEEKRIEAFHSGTAIENLPQVKYSSFMIRTVQEPPIYMGIILYTGIVKMPDIERMLSKNRGVPYHNVLNSRNSMSTSRFREISQVSCFVDNNEHNSRDEPGYDAFQKIRWICDDQTIWRRLYTIGRCISFDEIMVLCK